MGNTDLLQNKWTLVTFVLIANLSIGTVISYPAWQNQVKDLYRLSQTQVEVIGSVSTLFAMASVVGGILLDRCGLRVTGSVAMATIVCPIGILASMYYPGDFSSSLFPVLVLLYAVLGLGVSIPNIVTLAVFIQNYQTYAGRVFIAVSLGLAVSQALISSGLFNYQGVMVFFIVVQAVSSLICIFLLKQSPPEDTGMQSDTAHDSGTTNERQLSEASDSKPTNKEALVDSNSEETNGEKNLLVEKAEDRNSSFYGDVYGFEIMKIGDFWWIILTWLLTSSSDPIQGNIATYLRSFKAENHLHTMTTILPFIFPVVMIPIGILSDVYIDKVPRVTYIVGLLIIKLPLILAFTFFGDNMVIMYLMVICSYSSLSVIFVITPGLFTDFFGVHYFAINFGAACLSAGTYFILMEVLLGLLYDADINDVTTHTCYGTRCFYTSSMLICVLSVLALVTSSIVYVRTRRHMRSKTLMT